MSATTLGDLFPEMRQAVTSHRRYARKPRKPAEITPRMGTAERLKTLYPEIDSWHPVLVTKAWLHWCTQNQQDSRSGSTAKRAACPVHTVPAWCLKIARTQKSVSPM